MNEQHQVTYTDQATKDQMAKIDAMVEEIKRDNLIKQQDSQTQDIPEEVHEQTIPDQSLQRTDEIQNLTSAILANPVLTEQFVHLVLSDPQVYSLISQELAGLSEPATTLIEEQPAKNGIVMEPKYEQLRQEFNQYLDMMNTVDGFNQERFEAIQKDMMERFGTTDSNVFEQMIQHLNYQILLYYNHLK